MCAYWTTVDASQLLGQCTARSCSLLPGSRAPPPEWNTSPPAVLLWLRTLRLRGLYHVKICCRNPTPWESGYKPRMLHFPFCPLFLSRPSPKHIPKYHDSHHSHECDRDCRYHRPHRRYAALLETASARCASVTQRTAAIKLAPLVS